MTEPAPDDMTLDELRDALAPQIAAEASFDGWTDLALSQAAFALGVPADRARLAFSGPTDMIDAWFAWVDRQMATSLPADALAAMKIRQRITALVVARLDAMAPHREAARRALEVLALPVNVGVAARLGWRAADAMWRLAGDVATDSAFYSKRLTLGAVYVATLLAWRDDDSPDMEETRAFLDRRIAGVMRFEQVKVRFRRDPLRRFDAVRFLGRLRYPVSGG